MLLPLPAAGHQKASECPCRLLLQCLRGVAHVHCHVLHQKMCLMTAHPELVALRHGNQSAEHVRRRTAAPDWRCSCLVPVAEASQRQVI